MDQHLEQHPVAFESLVAAFRDVPEREEVNLAEEVGLDQVQATSRTSFPRIAVASSTQ